MTELEANSAPIEVPQENKIEIVKEKPTRNEKEAAKKAEYEKQLIKDEQIKIQITTLTVEQLNAIDLPITGISDREVAEKIGVARQTITKWRLYHPQFIAELGRRRQEVWGYSADRIRSMLPHAIEVVERSLDDPENQDRLKLAVEIIKQSGIFGTFKYGQETDATQIIERQIPRHDLSSLDQLYPPDESDKKQAMKRIYEKIKEP